MPSAKPTQPPAGDFAIFSKALSDNVKKPDGSPYAVFGDGTLPRFTRWVGGLSEYDGTGLRDVVNTNALYLDQVKNDLDAHKSTDIVRHKTINERLAELEASQAQPTPFPGGSS